MCILINRHLCVLKNSSLLLITVLFKAFSMYFLYLAISQISLMAIITVVSPSMWEDLNFACEFIDRHFQKVEYLKIWFKT